MKTYQLAPSGFDALRTKLLQSGITLPSGSDGTISQHGIELKYHYDGKTLTLTVQKKPFLIPAAMIWKTVDEWVGV